MRAAVAAPVEGSCAPKVEREVTPAAWQRDARLCELSSTERGACTEDGQQCVPTPTKPFSSQVCVYRVVLEGEQIPSCPASYPRADVLYSTFTDQRGCGPCSCAGPTGGRCEGTVTISSAEDCAHGFEYGIGTGCQLFSLPGGSAHASVSPELTQGTCKATALPEPTGAVKPSGNATVVCCP